MDFKATSVREENNLALKAQNIKKWNYGIICSLIVRKKNNLTSMELGDW